MQRKGRRWDLALLALLVGGVLVAFSGAAANDFVEYDDPDYVLENPHVRPGLTAAGIRWALTAVDAANWHPLTWLSHMLDVELFGLAPAGHHWTSVALHALNAVLLFLLLRSMGLGRWTGFLAAALFAWHPLRVESVAWVAERKDVLSGALFLSTLLAYTLYARRPGPARYLLVLATYALGLLAKPMLVTLPLVLLLLDLWPLRRSGERSPGRLVLEKLPLFALSAASAVVTLVAQRGARSSLESLPFGLRLENAVASAGVYLRQTLWPLELSCFYPHAAVTAERPALALLSRALFWGTALALAGALAWRSRRERPWWLVGLGWYVVMLLPVCGLIQVGMQAHADRYTYLPLIGPVVACVQALGVRAARSRTWRSGSAIAAALALSLCLVLTRRQVRVWRDGTTLFAHAIEVTEKNYVAHNNLGMALMARGETEEAERELEQAIAIHSPFPAALGNLGTIAFGRGELERARGLFEEAHRADPGDATCNLNLGSVHLALGDPERAAVFLERARAAGEDGADLHYDLGLLAQRAGDPETAEAEYRAALARDPEHAEAWSNLGQVLLSGGRTDDAVTAFERVVGLQPEDPVAHYNLGIAYERQDRPAAAADSYRAALALDATLAPAAARLQALRERTE